MSKKKIGTLATAEELTGVKVPEGYSVVWGEDWDGNPTMRPVRPGYSTVLRGKDGEGFDIDGPVASMCRKCGAVLVTETNGGHTMTLQRHYAEHGIDAGLLP